MASVPCTFPSRLTWEFTSARPKELFGREKDLSCFAIATAHLAYNAQITGGSCEADGVLCSFLLGAFFSGRKMRVKTLYMSK